MTTTYIPVAPGAIAPRPVRPLTPEQKARLAAKVTPEALADLAAAFNTPRRAKANAGRQAWRNAYAESEPLTPEQLDRLTASAARVTAAAKAKRLSAKAARSKSKR